MRQLNHSSTTKSNIEEPVIKPNQPSSSSAGISPQQIVSREISIAERSLRDFLNSLKEDQNSFEREIAFNNIKKYLDKHQRILYSIVSDVVYESLDNNEEQSGNLIINLENLLEYSEQEEGKKSKIYKTVLKIWDHVSLASKQHQNLKPSDEIYKRKLDESNTKFKAELTKETNAHMLIIVSIFTALAFIVFGSMSSLDGIFDKTDLPLFKTLSIATVWGLCISNMIFLFLHCASKMTNLGFTFKNESCIIVLVNLILIVLLLLLIVAYLIQICGGQHLLDCIKPNIFKLINYFLT